MATVLAPQTGLYANTQPSRASHAASTQSVPTHQPRLSQHPRQKYKKILFGFGICEVVIGWISLSIAIAAAVIGTDRYKSPPANGYGFYNRFVAYNSECFAAMQYSHACQGVWSGMFMTVTGFFGILLRNQTSRAMYIANMTMGIITAVVVFVGFVLSCVSASLSGGCSEQLAGLHALVGIFCFIAMTITIFHSSLCCSGVCFKDMSSSSMQERRHYVATQQQSNIVGQPQYVQGPNGQIMLLTISPQIVEAPSQQLRPPTYENHGFSVK